MKRSINFPYTAIMLLAVACTACSAAPGGTIKPSLVLVGSIPGGPAVKAAFGIPEERSIDFMRWSIAFDTSDFLLSVNYGESQPNTKGFKGDGEKLTLKGSYTISRSVRGEVYTLASDQLIAPIRLLRLDDNVYHLLDADGTLLNGTSGWSYSLSRQTSIAGAKPLLSLSKGLLKDTSLETVFTGRTPCFDSGRADLQPSSACQKMKWKLTLYRDKKTGRPSTYRLESTANRAKTIEQKWALVDGSHENPAALLLVLDPDTDHPIEFFVADDNVILLLDDRRHLLTGNEDFSYTLNRRQQTEEKAK